MREKSIRDKLKKYKEIERKKRKSMKTCKDFFIQHNSACVRSSSIVVVHLEFHIDFCYKKTSKLQSGAITPI